MKRFLCSGLSAVLFIFLALCCAEQGAPMALSVSACPQFALSEGRAVVEIFAEPAPQSDLAIHYSYMSVCAQATLPAGQTRAKIELAVPALDARAKLDFSLLEGDGYAVCGKSVFAITALPAPRFEFADGNCVVADPGEKASVSAKIVNKQVLAEENVPFELRDETGAVLATRTFNRQYPSHPFNFTLPKEWTGNHTASVWLGDEKLSGEYPILVKQRQWVLKRAEISDNRLAISVDFGSGGTKAAFGWMDLLDKYNARATFFLTGRWAKEHPEAVKEMLARGYELGNHTYTHKDITKLTYSQIAEELKSTSDMIAEITGGYQTKLLRVPYGEWSYRTNTIANSLGYPIVVQWSHDSKDSFAGIKTWEIVANAKRKSIVPGCIVLFHADTPALKEMDDVLDYYVNTCGYALVAVSDLFPQGAYEIDSEGTLRAAE